MEGILNEDDTNRLQHPPIFKVSKNTPHTRIVKYNPSTSHQLCDMADLDFGPGCADFQYMDLNAIK